LRKTELKAAMSDQVHDIAPEHSLQFYWYETEPNRQADAWWGQLAGGMYLLVPIREDLEALRTKRNVEKAMRRLESCVESYLVRAYELRERALGLLVSHTHQAKEVERLRHPKHRPDALSRLKSADQELTTAVENLLSLLDDDIGLRNLKTHNLYLSLGLYTGSDILDPYDALLDVSDKPAGRRKLETLLRREVKKTAQCYFDKVDALLQAVQKVLDAGDPVTRRSRNDGYLPDRCENSGVFKKM
jgi:hypothetical protein